ncbi:hypothetical protein WJ41_03200 [Burkholderia ubonensis]|uniref:hypothetical protein n=1 Tax=Burkholderia ubonensis TaxID=101571 RepID=UPI00075658B2|nr:hypothetical protein [Burkholderia ubonensis]KVH78410.1 hypothetical protein WJ41_03200 [Burkholderia ubonensis]KVU09877.1 hypothetical protein WK61_24160 [Burkholderia ubonensis]KVU10035.1 hypothetical protein WK61_25005 [Burkholderia ubonensis]OJA60393.1 hypothetical protein BGV69_05645 [Burkholderia ubonensis]
MTEDQINRRWVEILLDTLSAEKPVTIGPTDASCFINALRALLAPTQQPSGEVTDDDKQDAERYRCLRRGQHWSVLNGIGDTLRAEELDAAIDVARAQGGGRGCDRSTYR